jgi:hypothetical protein
MSGDRRRLSGGWAPVLLIGVLMGAGPRPVSAAPEPAGAAPPVIAASAGSAGSAEAAGPAPPAPPAPPAAVVVGPPQIVPAAPPPVAGAVPPAGQGAPVGAAGAAGAAQPSLYSLLGPLASYDSGGTDPWAVLPQTPGGLVTRSYGTGYGGRPGEAFVGSGTGGDRGVFLIDGFEVGDSASPGVPLGVRTIAAQQVEVSTGGADLAALSPGPQINLVERRGTKEWRASGHGFGSAGPLAAGASKVSGLAPGQAASENVSGDRVRDTSTLGAEGGGPLLHDAVWGWGGVDRRWSAFTAFGGQPLSGSDLDGAAKVDARLSPANSATFSWNRGSRDGSGEGAGPDRSPETTIDATARDDVWRLADTQILSSTLYVAADAGLVTVDSQDSPRGGFSSPLAIDAGGVAHGSWFADQDRRSSHAASLQVSDSGQLAGATQELRLAGEWRRTLEQAQWAAPDWSQIIDNQVVSLPAGVDVLDVWRDGDTRDTVTREAVWAGDTLSWERATATFGLRYDLQTPRNLPSFAPAVPIDPLLAAVSFAGNDVDGVRWQSLVPRLALAYAPSAARELVLRASLARYAEPLGGDVAARVDPAAPASAAYFLPPGSTAASPFGATFWYPAGFDPALPPGVSANAIDPRLHPEMTNEAILGGEYSLPGNGAVGLQLVYRRVTGILEDRLLVRDDATQAVRVATAADWLEMGAATGTLPNGAPYNVPYYDLRPGLTPTGGTLLVNGDRQQQLLGATLEWHQRLARRFTVRSHFTVQDWTWRIGPAFTRFADPTYANALIDGSYTGQPVAGQSPLPGGRPLYFTSPWSFDLGGVLELPGACTAALQINGRDGLPLAYYRTVSRPIAGPIDLRLTGRVDDLRTSDLVTVDARLDKTISRGTDFAVTVSLEALNLLVDGQVLRRETDLGVTRADFVDEVEAPRLLRLGLRVEFR